MRAGDSVLPVVDTVKTVDSAGLVTVLLRVRRCVRCRLLRVLRWLPCWRHERSRSLPAEEAELLTDDAMAMEAAGEPVLTVAGDADAFKVTTPMDLRVARALFGDSAA